GRQQGGGLHDLAGLAETTLRYVMVAPGYLHRVIAIFTEAFDCRDGRAFSCQYADLAGAYRNAVHVHRTCPAEPGSTAELGSGKAYFIPDKPQQWRRWISIELDFGVIDCQHDHDCSPPGLPWQA